MGYTRSDDLDHVIYRGSISTPNIAFNVKTKKDITAISIATTAIAVMGRFNSGMSGENPFRITPSITPAKKRGYFETVLQRSPMVINSL